MLEIGYRHTIDIEKFRNWNKEHGHDSYNGLEIFFLEERHKKLFFRGFIIEAEASNLFGEIKYWFSEQKDTEINRYADIIIWLWRESLQYFSPIGCSKQEEMDV